MASTIQSRFQQRWLQRDDSAQEPVSKAVKPPDYFVLITIITLVIIGLVMVFSASPAVTELEHVPATYYLIRQGLWAGVGLIAMLVIMRIDYHTYRRFSVPLLLMTFLMLLSVLLIGRAEHGAKRWIGINDQWGLQPSEIAKVVLIIYFSDWLSRSGHQERVKSLWYGFVQFAVLLGIFVGLIILQPDRGTAFVITLTSVSVFFVAGAHILQMMVGALGGGAAMWAVLQGASYSKQRFADFLNPEQSWHLQQALLAFGSGGPTGVGLGLSRQKFLYLPSTVTDTIYAVIGEEFGFMGCAAILLLFIALAVRGYRVAAKASDRFGALLATGLTSWLVIQALLNIGSVTATIPFTGVPLPFISYGGSSLFITLAATGILLNISRHSAIEDKTPIAMKVIE